MGLSNSIRHKLFFLLIIMGAIPFTIVIIVSSFATVSEWEQSIEHNGRLRNVLISEHVTELFEKNFYVMQTAALNSDIINYVGNPQSVPNDKEILRLMKDINSIFHVQNVMGLTANNGMQLIRTDGEKLVDISKREHFIQAMRGNNFVSDVILSMSTGKMIVVLTVPIKNGDNEIVGLVQRNFHLSAFQDFIAMQDNAEISIIILDRNGNVIANSDNGDDLAKNFYENDTYKSVADKLYKWSGTVHEQVAGEDALVSYSKNNLTGWTIITVQPYKYILNQVYSEIIKYAFIGFFMLLLISGIAYFTSVRATRPIIEITKAASQIASGDVSNVEALNIHSDDEFGEMAQAFNKMRTARDNYRAEASIDRLTKLYNKMTFENVCQIKLRKLNDVEERENLLALYIIDLDHFKEVNDTKGHQFGDIVLKEFSKKLRGCFRPYDCVARFGGDEFVVVIDNLPNTEVITRKADIINRLARELEIDGENAKISASIGIAIVPQAGTDYEEVFKAADNALYYVKKNGRDGWHCDNLN
ncbi:MAG: diguanylate cyclase [Selenomonadaceae bacterium]|nr:diguanylate cyclase [Selenomonadaceae bacterium]